MAKTNTDFFSHFPKDISLEIRDYSTNAVLDWSRYLFTRRVGKKQYAFCTHCKRESESSGLRHNHHSSCPACGTQALIKGSGMGRQKMVDEAYLLYYGKSMVNQEAIIARGFYLVRDYSKDYQKVETEFQVVSMYLFEPGRSEMYSMNYYWGKELQKRTSVFSEAVNSLKSKLCYHSRKSIEEAVNSTPFQYCTWEKYDIEDQVKVFDFAAKYPCMEYLTKLGMDAIVTAKISGRHTFGAINWRGKTIDKVLRLTKVEAKEWIKLPFKSGLLSLNAYQKFKRVGLNLTYEQAHLLCDLSEKERFRSVQEFTSYAPLDVIIRYIIKQRNRKDSSRWYHDSYRVFSDWKDYLKECSELGMDLSEDGVLFPNNLHEAHQKTLAKIKFKRDEALSAEIIKRAKELTAYCFEHNGLLIRPAASSMELFQEGKILNHCVGGYAQSYAKGNIDLLVIRRIEDPDNPFFTMEIRAGEIVQCRGMKNCNMTPEVIKFVDDFKAMKFWSQKRKTTDAKNNKPAERQEVAV